MDMDTGDGMSSGMPLNDSGVDFSNMTQASDFLDELLDDTVFQVCGNQYAREFWYGVCAAIFIFAVANIVNRTTRGLRHRAAASHQQRPASPANRISTAIACVTAICRELSYSQFTPLGSLAPKVPPIGTLVILGGYLIWILSLEFSDNDVEGAQHFTSLGIRAAWLAIAQVPLVVLLAGKNNIIGLVTGVSYERLNILHRWVSRGLLFLATLHVIFLHLAWNKYGLRSLEYSEDSCITTGYAVYVLLLWMNLSTIAPLRNLSYEFFVFQHLITFFGFIIAIIYHLPDTALYTRVYIYIPIALFLVDRIIRRTRMFWNNRSPMRATFIALDGDVTKVCVKTKTIKKWSPGSFVLLCVPKLGYLQSHPATIASVPGSHNGELVFLLKSHRGFTSRLHKSSKDSSIALLPTTEKSSKSQDLNTNSASHLAIIDGPYGGSHADYSTFDSVVLLAGSTGVTFTLPILLSLAEQAKQSKKFPAKRIVFIWVVKNTSWTSWIKDEVISATKALDEYGIELSLRIHVTCDDKFTTGASNNKDDADISCDCECDKSLGPCCCVSVEEADSDIITQAQNISQEKKTSASQSEKGDLASVQITSIPSKSLSDEKLITSASASHGVQSRVLPGATFYSGRPDVYNILWDTLEAAEGETGVGVCGPLSLNSDARNAVVRCSDERAVHKGTGAQGIYLHCECFGW